MSLPAPTAGPSSAVAPTTSTSPPEGPSEQPDFRAVVRQLKTATRIVVVCGAGVSTAANIPDFRSANGLFNGDGKGKGKGPATVRDLFHIKCFSSPSLLAEHHALLTELCSLSEAAVPTAFHSFLRELDADARLLRCYTQNIDGLEAKAGLEVGVPTATSRSGSRRRRRASTPLRAGLDGDSVNDQHGQSVSALASAAAFPPTPPSEEHTPISSDLPTIPRAIPLHGQLSCLVCALCSATFPITSFLPLPPTPLPCPSCTQHSSFRTILEERSRRIGTLRADVVLYGEEHPLGESIGRVVQRDLKGLGRKGERDGKVDFLLVAGTSLSIPGVKRIVKEMSKSLSSRSRQTVRTVFVNNELPRGAEWNGIFDVCVLGDVQEFVAALDDPRYATPVSSPRTPKKRKMPLMATTYPTPASESKMESKGSGLRTGSGSKRKRSWDSSDFTTPTKVPKRPAEYLTPRATPPDESRVMASAREGTEALPARSITAREARTFDLSGEDVRTTSVKETLVGQGADNPFFDDQAL